MIADKQIAKQVAALFLEAGARVDDAVELAQAHCSEGEAVKFKVAAGRVMAEILEVLNPIFFKHPDLAPPQVAHWYQQGDGSTREIP